MSNAIEKQSVGEEHANAEEIIGVPSIDLRRPVKLDRDAEDDDAYVYNCPRGHVIRVSVSAYRGIGCDGRALRPEPAVGAIACPQCEREIRNRVMEPEHIVACRSCGRRFDANDERLSGFRGCCRDCSEEHAD